MTPIETAILLGIAVLVMIAIVATLRRRRRRRHTTTAATVAAAAFPNLSHDDIAYRIGLK